MRDTHHYLIMLLLEAVGHHTKLLVPDMGYLKGGSRGAQNNTGSCQFS